MNNIPCWAAVTLLVLGSSSAAAASSARKECSLKQYGSIDLTVSDGEDVLLPVTLNDKPGLMSLYTNSAFSVVWEKVVEDWPLPHRSLPPRAEVRFGDASITERVLLRSFALGMVAFEKRELLVVPALASNRRRAGASIGAVGMDIFSRVDFELDLAHKKLNLFSQDHCAGAVVYWANAYGSAPLSLGILGNLYFALELEGKKIEATLAPNNAFSTLDADIAKRLYGFDENSAGMEVEPGCDPAHPACHYRVMQLTAPGFTIKNAKLGLRSGGKPCGLRTGWGKHGTVGYNESCLGAYPVALGRNVLKQLRLYFATKEKVLYFTAANATKQSPPP